MIQATVTTAPYLVTRRTVNNDYDLIARKTQMDNILLIPGLDRPNPNNLFRDGQVGGWLDPYDLTKMWVDNAGTTPMTASDLGVGIGRIQSKGGPVITFEQATSGDRPVWGRHPVSGIRNELQFTQEVNNPYWSTAGNIITANSTAAPDGSLTADTATLDSTLNFRYVRPSTTDSGQVKTATIFAKDNGGRYYGILGVGTGTIGARFDLQTGSITNLLAGATATMQDVGNGWWRLRYTNPSGQFDAGWWYPVGASGNSGAVGHSVFLWGAQLELGSTPTPYQRVTNRFDITETGQPDLYYFSGNGVNQSWSSNATVDFSGTNKVTVWAGVRRLSNAVSVITELGNSNANTFTLFANRVSQAPCFRSRGSDNTRDADSATLFPQPSTNSLVGVGRVPDLAQIYVNGTLEDSNTDSQGGSSYSNLTQHVFSRGGSSFFYNGLLYSLIIAGDNYDTRTIQQFSDWVLKPRRLITA